MHNEKEQQLKRVVDLTLAVSTQQLMEVLGWTKTEVFNNLRKLRKEKHVFALTLTIRNTEQLVIFKGITADEPLWDEDMLTNGREYSDKGIKYALENGDMRTYVQTVLGLGRLERQAARSAAYKLVNQPTDDL